MASLDAFDYMFKVVLVGDSGVGKSSLLLRYCDDKFPDRQIPTIGVDFKVKILTVNGKRVKLLIWDTAGQERFRTLTSSYYRGAHGVIMVYDATNRQSFESLNYWLGEIRGNATNPTLVRMLVATKLDVRSPKVARSEGELFAVEHSLLFEETSSKTRAGIDHCFEELVQSILWNPRTTEPSICLRRVSSRQQCYAC